MPVRKWSALSGKSKGKCAVCGWTYDLAVMKIQNGLLKCPECYDEE